MHKLKTAVIGLGRIGWQYHIPEIIKHDGFELSAVVDPVDERCQGAKDELNVQTFHSMEAMFTDTPIDAVVIASPTQFHKDQTILAMEQGCDVFCDKPLALNVQEGQEMMTAAEHFNKKLMVYQPHRATQETVSLLNILQQDLIGPIYMIKLAISDYSRRNDWQAFKKHGGGMLSNYGAHFIDQLMYLCDFSPLTQIACQLRTIASVGDADDVVKALMTNEKDIILDLDINMACEHKFGKWHILGKYGSIVDNGESWTIRYLNPDKLNKLEAQKGLAAGNREYRSNETLTWQEKIVNRNDFESVDYYSKVYEYFAENANPFVPISQTLNIMKILQQCREGC